MTHCCKIISQGCEEWGELTCLQTKLQVVLGDDEYGHGFDKKEESKGNAERTLASLLQLEIVGRQGKKGLAVGGEVKETHPQKRDGTESRLKNTVQVWRLRNVCRE